MPPEGTPPHSHGHAFSFLNAREREGLTVFSRRSVLKASLAGLAGFSLPDLLRLGRPPRRGRPPSRSKAVILLWMTGGPATSTPGT